MFLTANPLLPTSKRTSTRDMGMDGSALWDQTSAVSSLILPELSSISLSRLSASSSLKGLLLHPLPLRDEHLVAVEKCRRLKKRITFSLLLIRLFSVHSWAGHIYIYIYICIYIRQKAQQAPPLVHMGTLKSLRALL